MTVKELMRQLAHCRPDTEIVIEDFDNTFRSLSKVRICTWSTSDTIYESVQLA